LARISIILIFLVWLGWIPPLQQPTSSLGHYAEAFGVMGGGLLAVAFYSRLVARRLTNSSFSRHLRRYNLLMKFVRIAIPLWFAVLVHLLDYPVWVYGSLGAVSETPMQTPGFLVGTFAPLLAMVGLWWASYPAERALREQSTLVRLEEELPIRMSPTTWQYIVGNIRVQLLFMLAPVVCILLLRDALVMALDARQVALSDGLHLVISLTAVGVVMLLAPLLLVRILPTEELPASPLRSRLERLCESNGLKVKNILLWHTNSATGNAAVMGVIPQVRYMLITDLLLETMTDEHILAVFAHEIGHIVHRHLLWMACCAFGMVFVISGPIDTLWRHISAVVSISDAYASLIALGLIAPVFFLVFGVVVRRLERQADVFAARTITELVAPSAMVIGDDRPAPSAPTSRNGFVQSRGAHIVSGALRRVAAVNHAPIHAHEWLHGSIANRIRFLLNVSDDPEQTLRFDRYMIRLYQVLALGFGVMGAWTVWNVIH